MPADDFCYVTTTGRVSARPHEIEIWYARESDVVYLLAGGGRDADWVRNLARNPRCSVRIDADEYAATSRLLDSGHDRDEEARARTLVFAKYQARTSGDLASWRESALPVALDLGLMDGSVTIEAK